MSLSSVPASKSWSDHGLWVWRSCDGWFSRLRRALLSSCFAKKKVSKEEGDPGRRRALPGSLRYSVWAGAAELGPVGLKQSSPFSRPNLRCSAPHKGPGKRRGTACSTRFLTLYKDPRWGAGWFSPSRRQRRATEALAEKGRGLSEGRSPEFRRPRQRRVAQGTRAAGADAGSPFLCLLSFGEAKESEARLKRERHRSHECKTQMPWYVPGLPVWR